MVCLNHIDRMKQKLGIAGIQTSVNSWYCEAKPEKDIMGAQIDLLIVRKDQVINLCEMKYAIFPTLVTTYGVADNAFSGVFQSVITMDDLF